MTDRWLLILTLSLMLILPVSALSWRRVSGKKGLAMALAWIAIFVAVAWVFARGAR